MKPRVLGLVWLLLAGIAAPASAQAAERYGALAVDRTNGFYYGFAYDHPTRAEAEARALAEGRKKGGDVSVVLVWSGNGCGAYQTVMEKHGDAYGWGVARTRPEAEAIAAREAAKRSNGLPTPNHAWACNSDPAAPLKILRHDPVGEKAGGADIVLSNKQLVNGVAFSPDGKTVATLSYGDGAVLIWDTRTGALVRSLTGLARTPTSIAISSDGGRLAGSDSTRIVIWNLRTGEKVADQEHDALHADLAYSPDGRQLLAMGKQEVYGPGGGWVLWIMNASDASIVRKLTLVGAPTHGYYDADYSPDGSLVATGGDKPGEQLKIWDLASGRLVRALPSFDPTRSVRFSPDGRLLATSGTNGVVIWEVGSWRTTAQFGSGIVYDLAFSPDGRRLAGALRDGSAAIWDVGTGQQVARMTGHRALVSRVAFSNDGLKLASGSEDGTARLWDANTGAALKSAPADAQARTAPAATSPAADGQREREGARKEAAAAAAREEAARREAARAEAEAAEQARTQALNAEILARDAAIKARNKATAEADAARQAAFKAEMARYEAAKAQNEAEVARARAAREKYEKDLEAYQRELEAARKPK